MDSIDKWTRAKILELEAKGQASDKEASAELAKVKRLEAEHELQLALAEGANKLALARLARIARTIELAIVVSGTVLLATILKCVG